MTYDEAKLAIINHAVAFNGIDQAKIKYPNILPQKSNFYSQKTENGKIVEEDHESENFKKKIWCDFNILWGQSFIAGLADTPCTRRTGVISINCYSDIGIHDVSCTQLAEAWLKYFEYHTTQNLECLNGQIQNLGSIGDFWQINTSINFRVN